MHLTSGILQEAEFIFEVSTVQERKSTWNFSAIYAWYNIKNGKIYIGSAANLRKRLTAYLSVFRGSKHNRASKVMGRAFDKYGPDNFLFLILDSLPKKCMKHKLNRLEYEQKYLDIYQPFGKRGYNLCKIAGSPSKIKLSQKAVEELKRRGREQRKQAKITIHDIPTIFKLFVSDRISIEAIAKQFKISTHSIEQVLRRTTWYDISIHDSIVDEAQLRISGFDKIIAEQIGRLLHDKTPIQKIHHITGASIQAIKSINMGRLYGSIKQRYSPHKRSISYYSGHYRKAQIKRVTSMLKQDIAIETISCKLDMPIGVIYNIKRKHGLCSERPRLTEPQLHEIARLLLQDQPPCAIAKQFGVGTDTICGINSGATNSHIKVHYAPTRRFIRIARNQFSLQKLKVMIRMFKQQIAIKIIAKQVCLSEGCVYGWKRKFLNKRQQRNLNSISLSTDA